MQKFFRLFFLFLLSSCTGVIYQPDSYLYGDPKALQLNFKEFTVPSKDGTKLGVWYFLSEKEIENKTLILFFHGNAQNLSAHYYNLAWIVPEGHDFIIFDYRGYGISEGKPHPKGVRMDAEAMLDFAYEKFKQGNYKKFVVYGQSLGGNILLDGLRNFKHQEEISLSIFDSTFLSYQEIARDKLKNAIITYPFQWLAYLLISDETAAEFYVKDYTRPSLVIHGDKDQVIPYKFGEELFSKLGSKNKKFWKVEGGTHIDIFSPSHMEYKKKFLELLKEI